MSELVCTLCDRGASDVGDITPGPILHIGKDKVPLGICSGCVDYCRESFDLKPAPGDAQARAEAREKIWPKTIRVNPDIEWEPTRLECTFCQKNEKQVAKMLRPCGYYTRTDKSTILERVAHDKVFLAAYANQNPRLVFNCFICDECLAIAI